MGLYGNILTAVDGSIFTFDKIYYDTFSGTKEEIENSKAQSLVEKASNDKVFVGRFMFWQPYGEVYMKTVVEKNGQYIYNYVLIASLQLVKDLANAAVDDWINIIINNESGALEIEHRGPVIVDTNNGQIREDISFANEALTEAITGISKITYDKKGHTVNIVNVDVDSDYTLILDGGAFLNNNNNEIS